MNTNRAGILAGGNFIVDRVKVIDHFPQEEMLATILSESVSNGGGPYNLLKNLSNMQVKFPLAAVGLVGADAEGDWIVADCQSADIDVGQLHRTSARPTSYTDAMTVADTGRRTFFHHRGTNGLLDFEHFDFSTTSARIFYLGYLLLLDRLDEFDGDRSRASLVLESASAAGLATCVDMVSVDTECFQQVACAALPWTDHLMINETEAGKAIGAHVPADDPAALVGAARQLLARGVRQSVTIHSRFGAVCVCAKGEPTLQGALALEGDFPIQGANGAGDAFAAGYLSALHEGQPPADCLLLAVCTAAMSLTDPTPSAGVKSAHNCLKLSESYAAVPFA